MRTNHLLRLGEEEYGRVRPIFAELAEVHLNIVAILDGTCPGPVYVDDLAYPRTAYMISGDAHYLAGFPGNDPFNTAVNASLPRDTYFVLFCDPDGWAGALEAVLRDTYAVRARRRFYTLKQLKAGTWQDHIPDGYSMLRVDAELLGRGLRNTDAVEAWILDEWQSVEAFYEAGFGFCLVHDGDIASWSLCDYASGHRCEIGIHTDWHYRRRGFGTLTAAATAAHAVARGFSRIGWHCWDNNLGSIGVAYRVGFEQAAQYDVFINHWAAENVSDLTQEEFRAFAELYEGELETQPPASGFPHIVTAKAWALSGDRQGCYRHLNRAVELGWLRSVDQLRRLWPEFFWNPNLDRVPEWRNLVARLEA